MVEELDGLGEQRELARRRVEKQLNRADIEAQRHRLQQRDVIRRDLFIGKVEVVGDQRINMVVRKQEEDRFRRIDALQERAEQVH